jgi:hypothetical protein
VIYFIQDTHRGYIKIGFTDGVDAQSRLRALQTGNSTQLAVLASMEGGRADEKRLHEKFAGDRESGEWFRPSPALVQFIVEASGSSGYVFGRQAGFSDGFDWGCVNPARSRPALVWPLKIYLAGKVSKHCWRHEIVRGLRDALADYGECPDGNRTLPIPEWPVLERAIFDTHHYVGPYFASCDHGCFHGDDSHGIAAAAKVQAGPDDPHFSASNAEAVFTQCLNGVVNADVVFAWVDTLDCYGTVVEIGYAHALRKHIWIAGPRRFRDMWFLYRSADEYCCHASEPVAVLRQFIETTRPEADFEASANGQTDDAEF